MIEYQLNFFFPSLALSPPLLMGQQAATSSSRLFDRFSPLCHWSHLDIAGPLLSTLLELLVRPKSGAALVLFFGDDLCPNAYAIQIGPFSPLIGTPSLADLLTEFFFCVRSLLFSFLCLVFFFSPFYSLLLIVHGRGGAPLPHLRSLSQLDPF